MKSGDRAEILERRIAELSRQLAGRWAREAADDGLGLILLIGNPTASVVETDAIFSIQNLAPIGQHSLVPTAPIIINNNQGRAYTTASSVLVAYDVDAGSWLDITPGGSENRLPLLAVVRALVTDYSFNFQAPAVVSAEIRAAYPSIGHSSPVTVIDAKLATTEIVPLLAATWPYLGVLDISDPDAPLPRYYAIGQRPVHGISTQQSTGNTASWNNGLNQWTLGNLEFWPEDFDDLSINGVGPKLYAEHRITDQTKISEGGHKMIEFGGQVTWFECDQIEGWS